MVKSNAVMLVIFMVTFGRILASFPPLPVTFLTDICEQHGVTNFTIDMRSFNFHLSNSGILKTSTVGYTDGIDCRITFITLFPDGIVVTFKKLLLRQRDRVSITDDTGIVLMSMNGYDTWFHEESFDYYSDGSLTFHFTSALSSEKASRFYGFELVYTSVGHYPCGSSEFICDNYLCISDDLVCDGYSHCGDGSDQYCTTKTTTNEPTSVKTTKGSIILIDDYTSYNRLSDNPAVLISCTTVGLLMICAILLSVKVIQNRKKNAAQVPTVPTQPIGAHYPAPGMYPGSLYLEPNQMEYPPPRYSP